MTAQLRRTPLSTVPIFASIPPEQRSRIEAAGRRRPVRRGRSIFREGEASTGLHILLSGRLKAVRELPGGGEFLMHFVEAGNVFVEVPALLDVPYSATSTAVDDAEVFTLPLAAFKRLIAQEPETGLLFMRSMATKLGVLLERIEVHKSPRAEQRVARSLLARRLDAESPVKTYRLAVSKKLWAEELGLQPESPSRALKRLTQAGIVTVAGREITLCDPARLARVAAGDADAS